MTRNNKRHNPEQLYVGAKEVLIFEKTDRMMDFAVRTWKETARKAIEEKERFVVALSGGKTPLDLFVKLADEKDFPWDSTYVFMVDERFVPYESDENNYKMINCTLLRHLRIPAKNIHPILTTEPSCEDAALRYEKDMVSFFKSTGNKFPEFDLILLGIGDDGHTASLFPGEETLSLRETGRLTASIMPSDESMKERITLTFPVINHARNIVFLAAGENKAQVIKEIVENKNSQLPAAMIKPTNGELLFLLDKGAGSLLKR